MQYSKNKSILQYFIVLYVALIYSYIYPDNPSKFPSFWEGDKEKVTSQRVETQDFYPKAQGLCSIALALPSTPI